MTCLGSTREGCRLKICLQRFSLHTAEGNFHVAVGVQVRHLINAINEASEVIPGWDAYAATGRATEFWDSKTFKSNPGMTASYLS